MSGQSLVNADSMAQFYLISFFGLIKLHSALKFGHV